VSLNDGSGRSFDQEWPEFARRLERFLTAKGVDAWLRADVVQETATRVYQKWPRLDRSRPLWNLVVTIALGVLVDERRKASRVDLVPHVPLPEVEDVETRALHRLHLSKTRIALEQVRKEQRRVLLAEIGEAPSLDGPNNRINVLRFRARAALKSKLGPWAPAGLALRVRFASGRRLFDRSMMHPQFGEGALAVLVSLAVTVVSLGLGADGVDTSASPPTIALEDLGRGLGDMRDGIVGAGGARRLATSPGWSNDPGGTGEQGTQSDWRDDPIYAQETARRANRSADRIGGSGNRVARDVNRAARDVRNSGRRIARDVERTVDDVLP
jgi:DNA-directed RNA polymerase specialized sigma24 family protein